MKPLPIILGIALLVRLTVALAFPNVIAPDEVFQFLEQAHRLVFHQGIIPWEYQVGLRNWLIPLVLALPIAFVHIFTPDPLPGLWLVRILLCLASLGIVWAAAKWGERCNGRRGAWIAGLLAALWPDLWIMAPHPLEESLAADALVPAIYFIGAATRPRHVAGAAFLLGLAFTLREQLAPAVALAGIVLCQRDPKRWLTALSTAALPFLAAGMLDWYSWGTPFRSFWLNIDLNVDKGILARAASPQSLYVTVLMLDWLWTLPVVLALAWRAARRERVAGWLIVVIFLSHMWIAHKEFRYIFPAIALLVPLAGLGLAELDARYAATQPRHRRLLAGILLLGPLCTPFPYFLLQQRTASFDLFKRAATLSPSLVAIGLAYEMPFDELFSDHTKTMALEPFLTHTTKSRPDMIFAMRGTIAPPPGYQLLACAKNDWVPFGAPWYNNYCAWQLTTGQSLDAADAPSFQLAFPAVARPYIVHDRLAP